MKTRVALLVAMLSLAGCERAPRTDDTRAARASQHDTLPLLAVARDTGWQLLRDTVAGITWWAPKSAGAWGFETRGRSCMTPAQRDTVMGFDDGKASVFYVQGKLTPDLLLQWDVAKDSAGNYHSVGRQGMESGLTLLRGTRWYALTGERAVGVEMEGGGMALDWFPMITAAMQAPAGCVAIFDLSSLHDAMPHGDLWRILESVRFNGEDPARELPNQLFSLRSSSFDARTGVVIPDGQGGNCLVTDQEIPAGAPVAIVDPIPGNQQLTPAVVEAPSELCGGAAARTTVPPATHAYPLAVDDAYASNFGRDGLAVMATTALRVDGDTVHGDINRDGADEYFDACHRGDTTTYMITTRDHHVLWSRRALRQAGARGC